MAESNILFVFIVIVQKQKQTFIQWCIIIILSMI